MLYNLNPQTFPKLMKNFSPLAAEVKGQGRIHTSQCCLRLNIDSCHLLREAAIILSTVIPASSCYLMDTRAEESPTLCTTVVLPSQPGALLTSSQILSLLLPGGEGCSVIPLTFYQQFQLSAQAFFIQKPHHASEEVAYLQLKGAIGSFLCTDVTYTLKGGSSVMLTCCETHSFTFNPDF